MVRDTLKIRDTIKIKDTIRSSTPRNIGRSGGVSSGLAGDLGDQTSSTMDFGRGLPYARERDRGGVPGLVNPWDPITRVPRGINPEDHGRWKREDDARRVDEEPPKRDEPKGGKKPRGGRSGGGGSGRSFGGPNSGDKIDDDKGRRPGDSSDDDSDDDSDNGNGGNGNIGCTIKADEKYSVEEFDRQMGSGGCRNPPPSRSSITFVSHMGGNPRWGETPQPTGSERFFIGKDGGSLSGHTATLI
ncbi:hypothetical protein N39L_55460 [Limnospira platensis NIES-39]|nr:hypothetical protein APPUASWS_024085 [Arthrospira platensis str. Paraca]BAI93607.1 hypothetical protein NIES39_O03590 [Arthrospira platensis NIES-39]BDT15823.1 hypothetical protein N39L_55460 [Arthrospira platensis NIES-39]